MVMPRTSIEELKMRGTYQECRHGDRNPPKPELSDDTKPPAWLNRKTKRLYRKLAKQLVETGIFTTLDSKFLALYCALYVQTRTSLEAGEDVASAKMAQLRAMSNDLGLSPAGRERLTVKPPKKGPNKFSRFVNPTADSKWK